MDIESKIKQTNHLMLTQYGVSIIEYFNDSRIRQWLLDGEEPQAIVDEAATKFHLEKINIPKEYRNLVKEWREAIINTAGEEFCKHIPDDLLIEFLKNRGYPRPITKTNKGIVNLFESGISLN